MTDEAAAGAPRRRRLDVQAAFHLDIEWRWQTADAWDRIVSVYDGAVGGERLDQADVEDAAAFVSAFSWAAMVRGKYDAAEQELRRFFAHPDAAQAGWRTRVEFRSRLGLCALEQGRDEEALSLFRAALNSEDAQESDFARLSIRYVLLCFCSSLRGKGRATPGLTRFVEELVSAIRNRPDRKRRYAPHASRAKLRRHLQNTCALPPDPDPLQPVWDRVHEWVRANRPA